MSKDKLKLAGDVDDMLAKDIESKRSESEIDNDLKKVGNWLFTKIMEYRFVIILNIVTFICLFFIIPQIIFDVSAMVWMSLFVVFTAVPALVFYKMKYFKDYQIVFGAPLMWIFILTILSYCTRYELYGITNLGRLDRTPAWLDAIFVVFIILFFQYLGVCIAKMFTKKKKGTKK